MIFQILSIALGTAIASFLGVVIDRSSPTGMVLGRSRCDHCRRQLLWWENIPLISFILLRGKCRTCRSVIPYWLPLIELAGSAAGGRFSFGEISVTIEINKRVTIETLLYNEDIIYPNLDKHKSR